MSPEAIALASDFAIVVVTATALAYVARRTGQPTLVAYILTGIVLGPVVLGVVTEDDLIGVMAELGLGFLLFLLGLEMRFDRIKGIVRPVINVAAGQTVLQTALAFGVAYALGFRGMDVIVIALATVFGATPVIVKLLADQGDLDSLPGRIDVGVLIVQDIYLVIVLALVGAGLAGGAVEIGTDVARIFGLMAAIGAASYLSYRSFLPWLLGAVADDRTVLFVIGLAWAFAFIYAAERLELSVEVGAFIAGLGLAQLPYSTELKERMEPLTDLFLVVFFSSIGLGLAADHLAAYWVEALVACAVMMVGNFLIMLYLIDREGFSAETSFIGSVNMVQVSEFSLVVGALAVAQDLVDEPILGYLSLMALVTMTLSTYVILTNRALYERARPLLDRIGVGGDVDADLPGYEGHAVVVGYDDLVRTAMPPIREHFEQVVVVERSTAGMDELADSDVAFVYGDAKHGDVRTDADVSEAALLVSVARPTSVNRHLLADLPDDAKAFVAAVDPVEARDLYEGGTDYVILREPLAGTALGEHVRRYLADPESYRERSPGSIGRIERGEPS